jgi:putative glutamine amidotransferase
MKLAVGLNLDCLCDGVARAELCDLQLPRWQECVARADAVPVVVPLPRDEADVNRLLDRLHAFVYGACRDLDPRADTHGPDAAETDPEALLIRAIAERRLPFLGIGAGIQLLNVALGGSLRPVSGGVPGQRPHIYPHNPRHALQTTPRSFVARFYGGRADSVNSMHQVAIDEAAVGFGVTARSPDGLIEGIESETDDWFAVGLQFHPEPYFPETDARLFAAFVNEVRLRQTELVAV